MFKKLVTNLPYSPSLLNQVGFYTKRLQQEEFTRRVGLVFAILALLVNINLSFFAPEQSVLASPANDVVTGGIYGSSAKAMQDRAINAMRNSPYTKAIYDFYGVTEADIRGTTVQTISNADPQYRSVGRQSFGRGAEQCYNSRGYSFCERSMHAAYNYRTKNVKVIQGAISSKISQSDPWFAIAESCGNIIVRVGAAEDVKIEKVLSPQQDEEVKPGDIVSFRLKVSEVSGNYAPFVSVFDVLPDHTEFVDYSPKDLFDKVNVNYREDLKANVVKLTNSTDAYGGLGGGETRVIEIKVRILDSAPEGARLCNSGGITSLSDQANNPNDPCVTVQENPKPQCTNLRMIGSGGTNTSRSFEATAKADGATITSYEFNYGDGQTESVKSSAGKVTAKHTYPPGSYTASVVVKTSAGDVGGSGSCTAKITVDTPTPDPKVTCDYINLVGGNGTDLKRDFEVSATPANGASVNDFVVDFGDEKQQSFANTSSNKVELSHTYAQPGTYTAKVVANTSLGEVTNNGSCVLEIVISEVPEVCEFDSSLPKDDPECKKPEVCQFDPSLEPDDPNCKKPEVCQFNVALPPDDPACKKVTEKCIYNPSLEKDDPACNPGPSIIKLKKAENITQGIDDAHNTVARAGDTIRYSLITENDGGSVFEDYLIREELGDVLQYSDIVDSDGATFDETGFVLEWPKVDIAAGQVVTKTVTVKIKSPIPNTPISASDAMAYDLKLENAYGNNVTIKLPDTPIKTVEEVVTTLPNTGAGTNAIISTLFIGAVSYFYFRNRLISKELGMIKTEFSGGMA